MVGTKRSRGSVRECAAASGRGVIAQEPAADGDGEPRWVEVGGDLSIDAVPGPRPLPVRIVNAYVARLYRVAPHDPVVSLAFQRVVHMLDQPAALFAPRIVWRALLGRGRSRAAEGPRPGPHEPLRGVGTGAGNRAR